MSVPIRDNEIEVFISPAEATIPKMDTDLLRLIDDPWAIVGATLQATFDSLVSVQGQHAIVRALSFVEAPPPPQRIDHGSVAVIPLHGMLTYRQSLLNVLVGGTPIRHAQRQFREALADTHVKSIVLDIDSPGGTVGGLSELASVVREARGRKPIIAHANFMAASGAYWISSAADEFVASPGSDVGSIGILALHTDMSGKEAKAGIKTTVVSAGEYKTEGNPYQPLGGDARSALQDRVNEHYDVFVGDVAKGRGVSVATVRKSFGQGRLVSAKNALAAGMVDRVEPFHTTLTRLRAGKAGMRVAWNNPRRTARDPRLARARAQVRIALAEMGMDKFDA